MVMAQSLFITLKQQYPQSEIDVVAPSWSVPLLNRMPQVHQAIELPIGHKQLGLLTRYKIGKSLQDRRYDQAIVTPRSFKSALIPLFAKASTRTGYRGEMRYGLLNDIRPLDKSVLRQTVQRYVALGLSKPLTSPPLIPQPELHIDSENQKSLIHKLQLQTNKRVVGFMPGAEYGPAKQWPVEHFNGLARLLANDDIDVWVFGSNKEVSLGEQIAEDNGNVRNLCGKTSLTDVIDLLSLVSSTVTNDSGLMHIACATGGKVIAIYGSSDPEYTPPLSSKAKIVYQSLDCSPCFKRECPLGHTDCLKTITSDMIYQKL